MLKNIAILGSTGSIGTQALEVIRQHPDRFRPVVLTAHNNADLLIRQAKEFRPRCVVIGCKGSYGRVKDALAGKNIEVYAGKEDLNGIAGHPEVDTALVALVGFAGMKPVINALEAGKNVALANKESLVVAGNLITRLADEKKAAIIPVDSEHSAIFQCLMGEPPESIEKIYLTASGGPFLGMDAESLKKVTVQEALRHPNWEMGKKITIDSASLMNKGLEVIEAKWLFKLRPDQIEVIIHPQSVIHSIVQFVDGSMKAQMGLPDMKVPIQYALSWPGRIKSPFLRFSFLDYPHLTFSQADRNIFRNLALAFEAMKLGGNMPCAMNAANEVVVDAFLEEKIRFLQMPDIIEQCMENIGFIADPSIDEYVHTNTVTKSYAKKLLEKF
ncbi:MAG: 1-deoxy-D-xylulose-5-phosphate reductoisomerase [Bacteroidales bacterium]